jgi:hypothetical protein
MTTLVNLAPPIVIRGERIPLVLRPSTTGSAGAGTGDMVRAVYDPTNVSSDAFNLSTHQGDLDLGVWL